MHDRPLPRVTRRTLLAGSGALLVAGTLAACTSSASDDPNAPPPTGADDPDFDLRSAVIAAEASLLALYSATTERHPALTKRLAPFREHHSAHLEALNTAGAITVPTVEPPTVPSSAAAALRSLAAAEKSAASARVADCLAAARWQLSRELSLIGACEAAHHLLLTEDAS